MKKIYVEVFIANLNVANINYFKTVLEIQNSKKSPDDLVVDFIENEIKISPKEISKIFIHSTSWRYEDVNDAIILTYLVYSDYISLNIRYISIPISASLDNHNNNLKPSQSNLQESEIVNHAIRHLAFLYANNQHDLIDPILNDQNKSILKSITSATAGEE